MRKAPRPTPAAVIAVVLLLVLLLALGAALASRAGAQPVRPPAEVVKATADEGWYLAPEGVALTIERAELIQRVDCVPATDEPGGPERCLWFVAGPCRVVIAGGVLVDSWWEPGRCVALPLVRGDR